MTRYKVIFWFRRFKKFQFFNFEATERHLQRKLTRILTNFEKLWFLEMRDSKLTGSSAHVDKRTGITTEWSILEHLFNLGWSKKFESGEIMQFLCTFPIKNTCFLTTLKMGDFCGLGFVVFWVELIKVQVWSVVWGCKLIKVEVWSVVWGCNSLSCTIATTQWRFGDQLSRDFHCWDKHEDVTVAIGSDWKLAIFGDDIFTHC